MIRYLVCAVVSCFVATSSWASCMADGKSKHSVSIKVEGVKTVHWEIVNPDIRQLVLSNGFKLGVKIEPATAEKYRELMKQTSSQGFDELVKIDLYDMSEKLPKLLSTTWGGANSEQGFGPRGGANRVSAMGQQITMFFHKPACVTAATISSLK